MAGRRRTRPHWSRHQPAHAWCCNSHVHAAGEALAWCVAQGDIASRVAQACQTVCGSAMARSVCGVCLMRTRWTKEEELELERLAGDYPWSMVVERHNQWSIDRGRTPRTRLALARRTNVLGGCRIPEGEWLTIGAVSAILGIDREKPRRWIRSGKIRAKRESSRRPSPHYVSRRSFQHWARQDPAFFRPYPRDALVTLFNSTHVADWVYQHPPVAAKTRCRPVRCVETGRVYRSITEAASCNYVATSRIQAIVNTDETACGRHFVDAMPRYRVSAA